MKMSIAFSAVAATLLGAATPAFAAPVIQYQIFNGSTVIGSGSSTTGVIGLFGADSRFTVVAGNAVSAPTLPTPEFSSSVFSLQSAAAATAATLTVRVTTTGLTGYTGGNLLNTFTLNSVNGGSFTSATLSTYFDNANTAYGTGTLLATDTFTGKQSFSSSFNASPTPSALFSETAIYRFNFAAGGLSTISASSQLTAAAVPEPASWAMMIVGVGGVGFAMRRRPKVNARVRFA